MNNNNDHFAAVILGLGAVVFVINLVMKAISYTQKFYQVHKTEIFMSVITVFVIATVIFGLRLYFRFSQKQAESKKLIAIQEESARQLAEAKRTEAILQKKLDLALATKPKEIPKPKKLSLAARAAKET